MCNFLFLDIIINLWTKHEALKWIMITSSKCQSCRAGVCVSLSPSFRHRGLSPGVLCHGICGQGWHNKGLGWPGLWRDERRERDNRELGNNKTEHEHLIWILWTQGGLEDKNDYPEPMLAERVRLSREHWTGDHCDQVTGPHSLRRWPWLPALSNV